MNHVVIAKTNKMSQSDFDEALIEAARSLVEFRISEIDGNAVEKSLNNMGILVRHNLWGDTIVYSGDLSWACSTCSNKIREENEEVSDWELLNISGDGGDCAICGKVIDPLISYSATAVERKL